MTVNVPLPPPAEQEGQREKLFRSLYTLTEEMKNLFLAAVQYTSQLAQGAIQVDCLLSHFFNEFVI
jgi:hypothetical protein